MLIYGIACAPEDLLGGRIRTYGTWDQNPCVGGSIPPLATTQ